MKDYKQNEERIVKRFLFLPTMVNDKIRWLTIVKVMQRYELYNWADNGWKDKYYM